MLFQIDIKLYRLEQTQTKKFESNVILDRYKTKNKELNQKDQFESNVILDRYKTLWLCMEHIVKFESNVILDRYKTLLQLYNLNVLV